MAFEGLPEYLVEALRSDTFKYSDYLPVQRTIVPQMFRALDSGLPLDVCLCSPTGTGKTLCYVAPLLAHTIKRKSVLGDTQLRAVILVPTAALAQQVTKTISKLLQLIGSRHADSTPKMRVAQLGGDERGSLTTELMLSDGKSHVFAAADIVVAMPHQLLHHLQKGVTLSYLELLVVDEADQVLSGGASFTGFVSRLLARRDEDLLSVPESQRLPMHHFLCSATLTVHIAKISEIRLHNMQYFALDAQGKGVAGPASNVSMDGTDSKEESLTTFALPPTLHEHVVVVDQPLRHAALLLLLSRLMPHGLPRDSPVATESDAFRRKQVVLVFCATPDTTRVLGHFLTCAGYQTLEFTALASQSERQRAIVQGVYGSSEPLVIVTTDALMRGMDMPSVEAVILYDAPRSLLHYVHRVGRTARASAEGHAYTLLTKYGPSGKMEDGEVAAFRKFLPRLSRSHPVEFLRESSGQAVTPSTELVERANELLSKAQRNLQTDWSSALSHKRARDSSAPAHTVE